ERERGSSRNKRDVYIERAAIGPIWDRVDSGISPTKQRNPEPKQVIRADFRQENVSNEPTTRRRLRETSRIFICSKSTSIGLCRLYKLVSAAISGPGRCLVFIVANHSVEVLASVVAA